MAPFVGVVEIVCGTLVLAGLATRFVSIALAVDITVAIISTENSIWSGHGFWRSTLPKLKHYGFLSMLHEARTDISMLSGLIFLLMVEAGAWSLDAKHWQSPKKIKVTERHIPYCAKWTRGTQVWFVGRGRPSLQEI